MSERFKQFVLHDADGVFGDCAARVLLGLVVVEVFEGVGVGRGGGTLTNDCVSPPSAASALSAFFLMQVLLGGPVESKRLVYHLCFFAFLSAASFLSRRSFSAPVSL